MLGTLSMLIAVDVAASYGPQRVLDGLSFDIPQGQLTAVVGPSGCGKTTLLRIVAGFESVTAGAVSIGGREVANPGLRVAPEHRSVGIVFQDHVLFPHLDVAANIGFGLRRLATAERRQRVDDMLAAVSLEGMGNRYPHELSGGQQQRVALARALAPQPAILLLDEPFASLDERMRTTLAGEVRDLLKETGTTAILVTHDIEEAFAFADRIGVLLEGRLAQWGAPADLYRSPIDRNVAEFVSRGAFVPGQVTTAGRLQTPLGSIDCGVDCPYSAGTPVEVFLRPEDIVPSHEGGVVATVRHRRFSGASLLYTLASEGVNELFSLFPHRLSHQPGDRVGIRLSVRNPVYFKTADESR
jgi:iron(III) transport system ATP-binding protein